MSTASVEPQNEAARVRGDLAWLLAQMTAMKIRPAHIAKKTGLSSSYLSQLQNVTKYPNRTPTAATVATVVRAMRELVEDRRHELRLLGAEAAGAIEARLIGLEARAAVYLPPPGAVLPPGAATYVERDVDRRLRTYLRGRAPDAQTFVLGGPPASGKSTLLAALADSAPGFATVVRVDIDDLADVDSTPDDADDAVQHAVAAACFAAVGDADVDALDDDGFAALRAALAAILAEGAALFLVDAATTEVGARVVEQIARRWTNESRGTPLKVPLRIVAAPSYGPRHQSVIRSSVVEAHLPDNTKLTTTWFSMDEVAQLAAAYTTHGHERAAELAYEWFRGQPLLSHQLLEDLLLLRLDEHTALADLARPGTTYERHLNHVARLLADRERPTLLENALRTLEGEPGVRPDALLGTLGVATHEPFRDEDGAMSRATCRFYREFLPPAIERRMQTIDAAGTGD